MSHSIKLTVSDRGFLADAAAAAAVCEGVTAAEADWPVGWGAAAGRIIACGAGMAGLVWKLAAGLGWKLATGLGWKLATPPS